MGNTNPLRINGQTAARNRELDDKQNEENDHVEEQNHLMMFDGPN